MPTFWRRWGWPLAKLLIAAAILGGIGWQFYRDLTRTDDDGISLLHNLQWQPHWLALSALLYLAFLGSSCWYWWRLLVHFGPAPSPLATTRAYYVSQLGKYVPGKAWALLIRGAMVRGPNLRIGLAILTSFYEVLTTMAAGAMVAAIAFVIQPPLRIDLYVHPALAGMVFLGLCALPLLPGVFNRIAARLANKLCADETGSLPKIDMMTLAQGLAITSCGWCLMGLSVWAGLHAVLPEPPPLELTTWLRFQGAMGLAYVAGFLIPVVPGGVGVREFFLLRLLGFDGPEAPLVAAGVLLMRLAWTLGEVFLAAILYPWGGSNVYHSTDAMQSIAQADPSR